LKSDTIYFRHYMLYHFNRGETSATIKRSICETSMERILCPLYLWEMI